MNALARVRVWVVLLATVAVVACWGQSQTMAADQWYSAQHNFWWRPAGGVIPVGTLVNWMHFEHAWADDHCIPGTATPMSPVVSYNPPAQLPAFNGVGFDWMTPAGSVWNTDAGVPVRVNEQIQNVFGAPPIGGNKNVNAADGGSFANCQYPVADQQLGRRAAGRV